MQVDEPPGVVNAYKMDVIRILDPDTKRDYPLLFDWMDGEILPNTSIPQLYLLTSNQFISIGTPVSIKTEGGSFIPLDIKQLTSNIVKSCKHIFKTTLIATRSADEAETKLRICVKCNLTIKD